MKTGKLPKNSVVRFSEMIESIKKTKWKPKEGNRVYYIDMISLAVEVFKYDGSIKSWLSSNLHRIFRTRALAEKALRKIKKVLKECEHA